VYFKVLILAITLLAGTSIGTGQSVSLNRTRSGCGFGIDLPRFKSAEAINETEGGVTSKGGLYSWELEDGVLVRVLCLHVSTYGKQLSTGAKTRYLSQSVSTFIKSLEKNDKNYEAEQMPFESNGITGGEMRLSFEYREVILRSFYIGDRVFLLIGAYDTGSRGEKWVLEALNSFRKLNPIELPDAKIEEATPDELPQDQMLWKRTTDAADDNLKGKVQTVITDFEEGGKTRQRSSEEYYDKNRNLVKSIEYVDGLPETVAVWGVIDGARVRKRAFISYDADQLPPNSEPTTISVVRPDNNRSKADPRFSERFVYRYTGEGKLSEISVFSNDGGLISRQTISAEGNRVEFTYFNWEGRQVSREIRIVDASGDATENWTEGEPRTESVHFEYKYDDRGNWVEGTMFQQKIVRGKTVRTPLGTKFRKIAYYPDSE